MTRVVFVCLGNICRSPMAEAVFRHLVEKANLADRIEVDSAGTGHWHVGERPHRGTLRELAQHGIDASELTARQVIPADMRTADYLVAMDQENFADLKGLGPVKGTLLLFMDLLPEEGLKDVPDPYYVGNFDEVYRLVEQGCHRLLERIMQESHP